MFLSVLSPLCKINLKNGANLWVPVRQAESYHESSFCTFCSPVSGACRVERDPLIVIKWNTQSTQVNFFLHQPDSTIQSLNSQKIPSGFCKSPHKHLHQIQTAPCGKPTSHHHLKMKQSLERPACPKSDNCSVARNHLPALTTNLLLFNHLANVNRSDHILD